MLTAIEFRNKVKLENILKIFAKNGIETRPLWKPMHLQPLFKESISIVDGTSEKLFKNGLCLPSGTAMDRVDVDRISNILRDII